MDFLNFVYKSIGSSVSDFFEKFWGFQKFRLKGFFLNLSPLKFSEQHFVIITIFVWRDLYHKKILWCFFSFKRCEHCEWPTWTREAREAKPAKRQSWKLYSQKSCSPKPSLYGSHTAQKWQHQKSIVVLSQAFTVWKPYGPNLPGGVESRWRFLVIYENHNTFLE